jgi:hypothetical protein
MPKFVGIELDGLEEPEPPELEHDNENQRCDRQLLFLLQKPNGGLLLVVMPAVGLCNVP